MNRSSEDHAFDAYKRNQTPEHLSSLLSLHQNRAYNLCYQVLRHREDSEDAAQDALIKLVENLPRIESARAFRHWLYRTCVTCALKTRRRKHRLQIHEARYAMNAEPPASAPENIHDDERTTLFDALERIEDGQRSLIVQHYFERLPLTQIAAREGISQVAVWKRIDRARQSLKQTMATMGMAALIPDATSFLEACQPAVLPTNLVPGVLAKVNLPYLVTKQVARLGFHRWILACVSKPVVLGGIVMTVKWISVGIASLVLLGVVLVGGLLFRTREASRDRATTQSVVEALTAGKSRPGTLGEATSPGDKSPNLTTSHVTERKDVPAAPTPLKARLEQYKHRLDKAFPKEAGKGRGDWWEIAKWKHKELAGLKELILSDPASFLEFFNEIAEGDYLHGLLAATLAPTTWQDEDNAMAGSVEFSELPSELTNGLFSLLRSGTREQKLEILDKGYLLDSTDPHM
ncbi:MAG: sigma-70 family RNA polymerase sigma factor [Planctomycetes bacterium]|nr:sigma-70 family RNA polymerase sigma factor [Planctomycetota bacterium]